MAEGSLGRREFLGRGALGAGLAALAAGRVLGAGDRIGVGLIGAGGRGRTLMGHFAKRPEVEFRAICDVYEPRLKDGVAAASPTATGHSDYRELLARKD